MSRRKGPAISFPVDIESLPDNEQGVMPTPDSGRENQDPSGKKKSGRLKRATATRTKSKTSPQKSRGRCASGEMVLRPKRAAAGKKTKAASRRPALKEIPNTQPKEGNETEDVDDFDDLADVQNAGSSGHIPTPTTASKQSPRKVDSAQKTSNEKPERGRNKIRKSIEEIPETQPVEIASSNMSKAPTKRPRKPKPAKREAIPETQPKPMDVDPLQAEDDIEPSTMKPSPKAKYSEAPETKIRAPLALREKTGNASDSERAGRDPLLRKKFNDLKRKFDNLQAQYDTLRGVGIVEAQSNFKKLKKQTDESTQAADDVINSLRSQLTAKETSVVENAALSTQNTSLSAENSTLNAQLRTLSVENKSLTNEKDSLRSLLQAAQGEVKTLQAKFAATRQGSETISRNAPSSSAKSQALFGAKVGTSGNAEAAKDAQKRVLKEELYGDLTGLIIRDIKHREEDGEDVYDCIQTGRNGTLHFHLTLANSPPSRTPYDEVELAYEPLLDDSRDAPLLGLLPDYLKEDICFPRKQAAMFYRRITECVMKRFSVLGDRHLEDDGSGDVEVEGAVRGMEE